MGERDVENSDRRHVPWMIVCLVALPIVYVLGIGPAAWVYHVVEPPAPIADLLVRIYAPLERVCEQTEPLSRLFEWYLELWVP